MSSMSNFLISPVQHLHAAQLEKIYFNDSVHHLFLDNVTLDVTFIFHLPDRTTALGILLARTQFNCPRQALMLCPASAHFFIYGLINCRIYFGNSCLR